MPRSRSVAADDACSISRRWRIAPGLADMLVALEARARDIFSAEGLRWPGVWIISGFRSATLQARVNPSAPRSLHTLCPAMAVDLRVGDLPASTTREFWPFLGTLWKAMGGRWFGDRDPAELNHFEAPPLEVRLAREGVLPVPPARAFSRPTAGRILTRTAEQIPPRTIVPRRPLAFA